MNSEKKYTSFGERYGNCNKDLERFSHVLEFLILQNLNIAKDKTCDDNGLVIAIDAKWGSGKTSFLKMLKDKILKPYEAIGYDLYLRCIKDTDKLPDLEQRMADQLPVLVKKGHEIHVYGDKSTGVLGYTQLKASEFDDMVFPQIGQTETKLDKIEIQAKTYDAITSKGCRTQAIRDAHYLYSYEFKKLERDTTKSSQENYTIAFSPKNKKKVVIIEYNAWENDYFDDPFTSFVGQICAQIEKINRLQNAKPDFIEDFKVAAKIVLNCCVRKVVPILDGTCTALEELSKGIFDIQVKNFNQLYSEREKLKNALQALVGDDCIVLFFIDELDRCKPKFAINFLEIVKHFFNAENVVFIMALDKEALANSVRHCYGQNFNGDHYLSRIFDLELKLPIDNKKFYEMIMGEFRDNRFSELFQEIRAYFGFSPREWTKYLIRIKNLQKIPTWNKDEVYLLAAIKMYNPKVYKNIRDLNVAKPRAHEGLQEFLRIIKGEDVVSGYQVSTTSKLHTGLESIRLFIATENRSELSYMLDAVDYMF